MKKLTQVQNGIDPTVEFPKVEKMLYQLAWKTSEAYSIPFEECKAEAYYGFMKACGLYRPDKGNKFSSWVYFITWAVLKDMVIGRSKDPLTFVELEDDCLGAAAPERAACLEVLDSLSAEARELVEMLLESPKEVWGQVTTPHQLLAKVKDHMIWWGQSPERVKAAIQEITVALRTYWGQSCAA